MNICRAPRCARLAVRGTDYCHDHEHAAPLASDRDIDEMVAAATVPDLAALTKAAIAKGHIAPVAGYASPPKFAL